MYLDRFYKLPGNKGYEKCILYRVRNAKNRYPPINYLIIVMC